MKEKFEMLLDENEEIKWCNGINVSAYVKKEFFYTFLLGLFPPIAMLMLGIPYSCVLLLLSLIKVIPIWIGIIHFIFSIVVCLFYIVLLIKKAKNTYCCITNKRIIKRSGAFTNDFKHYALKNIGNVQVDGSIFDKKGSKPSADLLISVKDFYINTEKTLKIESLNDAYEACKVINKLTEGNNVSLRVDVDK